MSTPLEAKAQSVAAQLRNFARQNRLDYNSVLTRYMNECFLARLACSPHADNLILKGGMSLLVVSLPHTRPTKDIDFLGRGVGNTPEQCQAIISQIAPIELNDGVSFDTSQISHEVITEEEQYPGVRIKLVGYLGPKTHLPLQIDIGFGDITVPAYPPPISFPQILELHDEICVRVYSLETSIAEKFEAIVSLGQINSRMKDIYDIWMLCAYQTFAGEVLSEAILKTFERRHTSLPESVLAFDPQYLADGTKQEQWAAFLNKNRLKTTAPEEIAIVLSEIATFLSPVTRALTEKKPWLYRWDCEIHQWIPKANPLT